MLKGGYFFGGILGAQVFIYMGPLRALRGPKGPIGRLGSLWVATASLLRRKIRNGPRRLARSVLQQLRLSRWKLRNGRIPKGPILRAVHNVA